MPTNPQADQYEAEREEILGWRDLTQNPFWETVMLRRARVRLAEATMTCCRPEKSEEDRRVAMGEVKAWSEIMNLKDVYEKAYEDMKALESNSSDEEPLVGNRVSDQWYEHTP